VSEGEPVAFLLTNEAMLFRTQAAVSVFDRNGGNWSDRFCARL